MLGLHCYADLSLVAVGRGCSLVTAHGLLIVGASLVAKLRPQDVQASVVATRVPSSCGTRAELPGGMWNLSRAGIHVSPALAGGFLTTGPPGRSLGVRTMWVSGWVDEKNNIPLVRFFKNHM